MAELVCDDSAQSVVIEVTRGVRRDHHQMSARREGVHGVGVHHAQSEAAITYVKCLRDFIECALEARCLLGGGAPGPDQSSEDDPLYDRYEESQTSHHVDAGRGEVRNLDHQVQGQPERNHGNGPQRQDGDQRNGREKSGAVEIPCSAPVGHGVSLAVRGVELSHDPTHRYRAGDPGRRGLEPSRNTVGGSTVHSRIHR